MITDPKRLLPDPRKTFDEFFEIGKKTGEQIRVSEIETEPQGSVKERILIRALDETMDHMEAMNQVRFGVYVPPGHVHLVTLVIPSETTGFAGATPVHIVTTKELARDLALGTKTVDALDPLLGALDEKARNYVKQVVEQHIKDFRAAIDSI